jgi:hypothetical protein
MTEPNANATNPTVAFERRDVSIRGIVWFGAGLSILIGVSLALIYGVYWHLVGDRARVTRSDFPVAEAVRRRLQERDPGELLPPAPRLDGIVSAPPGQAAGRVVPGLAGTLGEGQEKDLAVWQWTDKKQSAARIPVREAMNRLLAKPGELLKARPGAKPFVGAADQPNASNSGRGPVAGGQK